MKKADLSSLTNDVNIILNNQKSVLLSDLDSYRLDCSDVNQIKLTQGVNQTLASNILARRHQDDLVVDIVRPSGQTSMVAENFYLQGAQNSTELLVAHPVESAFVIDASTESFDTLADGSQVIYIYGDENILSDVIDDYSIDNLYKVQESLVEDGMTQEGDEQQKKEDEENADTGFDTGILAIIGVASATTMSGLVYLFNGSKDEGNGGNQESVAINETEREFSGSIILGPLIENHGLSVELYDVSGNLIAQASVDDNGNYLAVIPGDVAYVKAVVKDTTDAPDYVDEATGEPKDLQGLLSAWSAAEDNAANITMHINPITTLAATLINQQLNTSDDSAKHAEIIESVNKQVAKTLLGSDKSVTTYDIVPAVDQSGAPVEANAGGSVLSMISALEDRDGLTTTEVVESLASALEFTEGEMVMTGEVIQLFSEAQDHLGDAFVSINSTTMEQLINLAETANHLPVTQSVTLTLLEDRSLTFNKSNFSFVDQNAGDKLQAIKIESLPEKGDLLFKGVAVNVGQVIDKDELSGLGFQADLNDNGADYAAFDFRVSDGIGFSERQTVNLTVTEVNDNPVSEALFLGTVEHTQSITLSLDALLAQASDADGDAMSILTVTAPSSEGIITSPASNSWSFKPADDFTGEANLTLALSDGKGITTFNATIDVIHKNYAPVIDGDITAMAAGYYGDDLTAEGSLSIQDANPDESGFIEEVVTGLGSLQINQDGSWNYWIDSELPEVNALGSAGTLSDSLTVRSLDGTEFSIEILINAANIGDKDAPRIENLAIALLEGEALILSSDELLAAKTGIPASQIVWTLTSVQNATIEGGAALGNGSYEFTQQQVNDRFISLIHDGSENAPAFSAIASIGEVPSLPKMLDVIGFNLINDAPVLIVDSTLSVDENAANTLVLTNASATDEENDTLTYSLDNNAAGRFAIDADTGEITVTNGSLLNYESANLHTLVVRVSDGGLSTTATIQVNVNDINEPAIIFGDTSGDAIENEAHTSVSGSLHVVDPDAGTSSFLDATHIGNYGSLHIQVNGAWVFTADNSTGQIDALAAGEMVEDVFTVETLGGTTQDVTVQITGVNDTPDLGAEGYTTESVIPDLISNNDQGVVVTASEEHSENFLAYMAMDGVQANEIYHHESWAASNPNAWLQVDLGEQINIIQYQITGTNKPSRSPKSWQLLGSDNGFDFEVINTQSGEVSWGAYETRLYQLDTPANYQYYRINILENNGDTQSGFDGFQLFELIETSALSVDENNQVTLDVLANDTDMDHLDSLSLMHAEIVNHRGDLVTHQGMVSVVDNKLVYDASGAFEFMGQNDATYVTIRYLLQDNQAEQVEATVIIKVTGVNDVPEFEHISMPIDLAETLVLSTAHLFTEDVDGNALDNIFTLSNLVDLNVNGATDLGSGRYSFTQLQLEAGDISITHIGGNTTPALDVEVSDGFGSSGVQKFQIIFNAQNDEPTSSTVDLGMTNEDTTVSFTQDDLLQNVVEINIDDKLSVHHVRLVDATQGLISEVSEGVWEFSPTENFSGDNIQIEYDIHDHALISHMDFSNGLEEGWSAINDFQTVVSGGALGISPTNTSIMHSDEGVNVDGISYTVDTRLGIDHHLTLVVSQQEAVTGEALEIVWNNEVIETLIPTSSTEWHTFEVNLPDTGMDVTDLIIRESTTTDDLAGVRIDSVTIYTAELSTITGSAEIDVVPVDDEPTVQSVDLGVTPEDTPLVFSPTDLLAGVNDIDSNSNHLTITSVTLDDDSQGAINTINSIMFGDDTNNALEIQQTLPEIDAFTIAFDFIATGEHSGNDTLFHLSTPNQNNSILISANRDAGTMTVAVDGNSHTFSGLNLADGQLQVFGISWSSESGALKLYNNAELFDEAVISQGNIIEAEGLAHIGQAQGSYGSDLDPAEAIANVTLHRMSLVTEEMPAEIIGLSQPLSFFSNQVELDVQSVNGVIFDGSGKHQVNEVGVIAIMPSYYVYSPTQNLVASDVAINFSVTDGSNTVNGEATLDIEAVNDAPVVNAVDLGEFNEDATISFTQDDLLAGASDVDSDNLRVSDLQLAQGVEGVIEVPKMIFPDDGNNAIEVIEKLPAMDAFTLSFDYQSTGAHSAYEHIFSLAVPDESNAILLGVNADTGAPYLYINNLTHIFSDLDLYDGELRDIDLSWQGDTGALKLYINGALHEELIFVKGKSIASDGLVFIGQDQDSYGGGLSESQGLTHSEMTRFTLLSETASAESIASDQPLALQSDKTVFDILSNGQAIEDLTGKYSLATAGSLQSEPAQFVYHLPENNTADQVDFQFTVTDGELHTQQTASLGINSVVSGQPYQLQVSNDDQSLSLMEPTVIDGEIYYWLDANQDNALTEADRVDLVELANLMDDGARLQFDEAVIELASDTLSADLKLSGTIADVPYWSVDHQTGGYDLDFYDEKQADGYVLYQVIG